MGIYFGSFLSLHHSIKMMYPIGSMAEFRLKMLYGISLVLQGYYTLFLRKSQELFLRSAEGMAHGVESMERRAWSVGRDRMVREDGGW